MEDLVIGAEKVLNGSGISTITAEISDVRLYKRKLSSLEKEQLLTFDWI